MWSLLSISLVSVMMAKMNSLVLLLGLLVIWSSKLLVVPFSHFLGLHTYFLASDQMAGMLMLLSIWITLLMILAMKKTEKNPFLYFKFKILNLILMGSFLVNDYLGFFLFFELSLMPTLIMILSWGVQPERIRAGSYLMIYTMVGAIPLLLCMVYQFYSSGSSNMYNFRIGSGLSKDEYKWLVIFWVLAFLMKLPIYGVHLWLPKAHVEAPVSGSMMLAGVLLKLGGYGVLRVSSFCKLKICSWSKSLYWWLLYSMCLVGFICFRQSDLKSLVAYSSVAHMSLVMLGMFSFDYVGGMGVMGMLVAHGVCSSGLFFGVQCFYKLSGSRSIILNRGIINLTPMLAFFWLILCAAKASAPPSLNLLSEFLLISSIVSFKTFSGIFCFLSVFLAGLFSIYLYVLTCHGKWKMSKNYWSSLSSLDYLVLLLHIIPLYGLIFLGKFIFPL